MDGGSGGEDFRETGVGDLQLSSKEKTDEERLF